MLACIKVGIYCCCAAPYNSAMGAKLQLPVGNNVLCIFMSWRDIILSCLGPLIYFFKLFFVVRETVRFSVLNDGTVFKVDFLVPIYNYFVVFFENSFRFFVF